MSAQQGTADIGAGIVDPQEHEHGEGHMPGIGDVAASGLEGQDVDHREGQGDVELAHHRIGPVVDGVGLLQVEFGHHQVDEGDEVGDEHGCWREAAVVARHGEEEIDTSHGADHAVDGHVLAVIDQACELPDGESRH